MQTSTKAALGVGAVSWLGGLVGEGHAVLGAARKMNAQIDADCAFLDQFGYLPEAQPYLPPTGARGRSKVGIAVRCWLLGDLIVFALVTLPILITGFVANDPTQPPAMTLVGGLGIGFGAAILGGWLPGAILFTILGTRENMHRSAGVVLDEFQVYWAQRTDAMHAIPQGSDPRAVRDWLAGHRLPVDDE